MAKLTIHQALKHGVEAHKAGQLHEAKRLYNAILKLQPKHPDANHNLGVLAVGIGKIELALPFFKIALKTKSKNAKFWYSYIDALIKLERLIDARALLDQAKGKCADGLSFEKLEQRLNKVSKASTSKPTSAGAYYNMGIALVKQSKLEEAIFAYKKAISIQPDYADAYYNMGNAFEVQSKLEEAIVAYKKVISINPDHVYAYNNMGNVLNNQGKLDASITSYKQALSLKPVYAEAYNNMGLAFKGLGKLDEAVACYEEAFSIKPDYPEAYHNCSFCYNLNGNLKKGLELYEWRSKVENKKTRPPRQELIWDGHKSLKGKSFLVYEEQGIGDQIQFCRYLPLLEQKGADVTFKVRPSLHTILQSMGINTIFSSNSPDETQIDFEAPLMSLPHLFGTHLDTIPSTNSYLYADCDRIKYWSERLSKNRFKIGICWQGSKTKIDVGRSFPLTLFKNISEIPNVELISLHKGEGVSQIGEIDFNLTSFGSDFDSGNDAFIDTAAVMMNCDLIITSDTAVAHLAGALGCQTWLALKHIPDWRWMLNRIDSPWYPTLTLYRQKKLGDWASVFDAINRDLNFNILKRKIT